MYLYGVQRRCSELSTEFAALAEAAPMSFDQVSLWCLIGTAPWDPREVQPILAAFVQADPSDRESRLALAEAYGSLGQHEDVDDSPQALTGDGSRRPGDSCPHRFRSW